MTQKLTQKIFLTAIIALASIFNATTSFAQTDVNFAGATSFANGTITTTSSAPNVNYMPYCPGWATSWLYGGENTIVNFTSPVTTVSVYYWGADGDAPGLNNDQLSLQVNGAPFNITSAMNICQNGTYNGCTVSTGSGGSGCGTLIYSAETITFLNNPITSPGASPFILTFTVPSGINSFRISSTGAISGFGLLKMTYSGSVVAPITAGTVATVTGATNTTITGNTPNVTGGTAPYTYSSGIGLAGCTSTLPASALGSVNTSTGAHTINATGLAAGTYTYCIQVCDANNSCTMSNHTVTVTAAPCNAGSTAPTVN